MLDQVLKGPPPPPNQATSSPRTHDTTLLTPLSTPPPPAVSDLQLPEELVQICLRAMARPLHERYPDARALAEDVLAWLEGARRREHALDQLAAADPLWPRMDTLRLNAEELQREAAALATAIPSWSPLTAKQPLWDLEDQARRLEREADLLEVEWLQAVRGALVHCPDLQEAHERLADYYQRQHARAEARRDLRAATQNEALLRHHDRGRHRAWLRGEGALTLITEPPGAFVRCFRYVELERRLVPQLHLELGTTPLLEIVLPMGSYVLEITREGFETTHYPVSIGRLEHWSCIAPGETTPSPTPLLPAGSLGPHDCYVPRGYFWSGGDERALNSLPRRRLWCHGFVMLRFPVTNRDYLAFLNDRVAEGDEASALRFAARERSGVSDLLGPLLYQRDKHGFFHLGVDTEGDSWDLSWPASMIDVDGARAYGLWKSHREGFSGSAGWRLPLELEFEKAARGTDARLYPWGDFADSTWACMRESTPDRPRPSPVDAYPIDCSPYGIRGLAGNVREWCLEPFLIQGPPLFQGRVSRAPDIDRLDILNSIRGGGWGSSLAALRTAYRSGLFRTERNGDIGFRLVRALEPIPEAPPRQT